MKQGWEIKKLGEVCTITMGQSPSSNTYNDNRNGLPFFQGNADFGKIYPTVRVYCSEPIRIAQTNDILISVRAPIGAINIANCQCCIGRGLASIKSDMLPNPYIYHALIANREKLISQGTGSTFKSISKSVLTDLVIPIPPIAEQEKIVAELDCLSGIIEKKKQQLKELDALAQSIFYEMFGSIDDNHHNYETNVLSEVFSIIKDGTHQTPQYIEDKENGYKFLSAKDVVEGVINWQNIKYIPENLHLELYKRVSPQRNDILLCKNGTYGICALVETDEIFEIYVSLALLRPKGEYVPKYLVYAINNPSTKQQFDRCIKGIGVPNLHLGEIKKTNIITPPLTLQQEFAFKIEAIEKQKELIKQSIQETETLFNSRMDYYFN